MAEDVGFVVALMLAAVLTAAGLPSENIVYPRIIESRDLSSEKTLYIRPGLVLSLEKSKVFSDNFIFSEDDGVNRHDRFVTRESYDNSRCVLRTFYDQIHMAGNIARFCRRDDGPMGIYVSTCSPRASQLQAGREDK